MRGRTTAILTGWTVFAVFAALLLAAADRDPFRHWLPLAAFVLPYLIAVWFLSLVRRPPAGRYHQSRRLEEKLSILRGISARNGQS